MLSPRDNGVSSKRCRKRSTCNGESCDENDGTRRRKSKGSVSSSKTERAKNRFHQAHGRGKGTLQTAARRVRELVRRRQYAHWFTLGREIMADVLEAAAAAIRNRQQVVSEALEAGVDMTSNAADHGGGRATSLTRAGSCVELNPSLRNGRRHRRGRSLRTQSCAK